MQLSVVMSIKHLSEYKGTQSFWMGKISRLAFPRQHGRRSQPSNPFQVAFLSLKTQRSRKPLLGGGGIYYSDPGSDLKLLFRRKTFCFQSFMSGFICRLFQFHGSAYSLSFNLLILSSTQSETPSKLLPLSMGTSISRIF